MSGHPSTLCVCQQICPGRSHVNLMAAHIDIYEPFLSERWYLCSYGNAKRKVYGFYETVARAEECGSFSISMRYYLNNLWNHYSWWPKFKSQIWHLATISPCIDSESEGAIKLVSAEKLTYLWLFPASISVWWWLLATIFLWMLSTLRVQVLLLWDHLSKAALLPDIWACEIISQPASLYKNLTWARIMWHAAAASQLPAADCNSCGRQAGGLMHTESALLWSVCHLPVDLASFLPHEYFMRTIPGAHIQLQLSLTHPPIHSTALHSLHTYSSSICHRVWILISEPGYF